MTSSTRGRLDVALCGVGGLQITPLRLTLIWCLMATLAQVAHQQQPQASQQSSVSLKSHPLKSSTPTTTTTTTNKPRPTLTPTSRRANKSIAADKTARRDHDRTEADERQQLDSDALQVRRVARNVRRKIDQMSNRVDQIQSIIAQDHHEQQRGSRRPRNESTARESRSGGPDLWLSAPLDENGTGDHLAPDSDSGDSSERQSASNSTGARWSSPVISSVIPGRTQEFAPDSTSGASSNELSEGQTQATHQTSGDSGGVDLEQTPVNKSVQEEHESAGGGGGGAELGQSQNQTQITNEPSQVALPSMLGPEWASSQNYNYFSELNAKNHGGGGVSPGTDTPITTTTTMGSKFQNMTILNSETDLANSYSAAGPTLMMGNMTGTPPGHATTPRPLATDQQDPHQQQQRPTRKSSSVHTYSVGNYGKSSRDQLHATSTTSQPTYRAMGTSHGPVEPHIWTPAAHLHHQQQQHRRASPGNNGTTNHRQSLASLASEHEVRWPTLATPAPPTNYPNDLAAQANQIGLPASESNLPAANRYSSVMMPPSALTARQQQQQQHDLSGDDLSAHRASLALGPDRPTSGGVDVSQDSPSGEHDRRRSSVEARRQLTNSVDTTIYERRHDQQPPQQTGADIYSSRLDGSSSDTPLANNNSTVDRSDQLSLKHRSSGNSMMQLDEQVGGDNSVVSPAPLNLGGGGGGGGHTPSSIDTGALQQPSPLDTYPQISTGSDMSGSGVGYTSSSTHNQQLDPRAYYATINQQQVAPEAYNSNSSPQSLANSYASISQELQEGQLTVAQQQQLISQLDQLSDQQQAQSSGSRHYQLQQQPAAGAAYSTPVSPYYATHSASSLQEALQAAAANQNEQQAVTLARQQRAENNNPTTAADYSAYLQSYQQQQRALAAQLAAQQQQQQQRMLARAYHESSGLQHQQQQVAPTATDSVASQAQQQQNSLAAAIQGNMLKRYSPETALANYLTARSSSMSHGAGGGGGVSSAISDQPAYYYQHQQQQQQQPVTSGSQYYSTSTPGGASNAYLNAYRAAQLASLANYQRMLTEAAAASQQSGGSTSTSGSGSSQSSSGMYATSAMNQPVFYEAPQSLLSQQRAVSGGSDSNAVASSEVATSNSAAGSGTSRSNASRRNYFGNLFKPSAASRYYYGPTLLSPISLASPAGLHAIYATAPSATNSADTTAGATSPTALSQYYALNPYMAAAAMISQQQQQQQQQQYAQHFRPAASATYASYQDPTGLAAAQQYQQALAAAAAASGFQPHYLSPPTGMFSGLSGGGGGGSGNSNAGVPDADMAESSLDGSSTSTSSADGSALSDSETGSSSSSSSSSGTSKSSSGGMKQWLTVASLLAGILPMGLVMASMLPMLTVAGRKKRELELFGARNLSEILTSSWQGGSGMLKALMQPARYDLDGVARSANTSSRVLSELVAGASDHSRPASKSARLLGGSGTSSAALKPRRLHLGLGGVASSTTLKPGVANSNHSTPAPHATQVLAAPSIGGQQQQLQSVATTTPGDLVATTTPAGPLKSTMKKVLSKVNNLIVTAQKRKHRSSPVESGSRLFQVPGFLGGGGNLGPVGQSWLGLKSLFDTTEVKRYLADVVRARILAAAAAAAAAAVPGHQEAGATQPPGNSAANSRETPAETRLEPIAATNETRATTSETTQKTHGQSLSARDLYQQRPLVAAAAAAAATTTRNQTQRDDSTATSEPTTHLVAQIQVAPSQQQQVGQASKVAGAHQQLEVPVNEPSMGQRRPANESAPDLKGAGEANSKRGPDVEGHLLPCLYKVVCDLASKLKRTSMKNQLVNEIGTNRKEETEAAVTQQIVDQLMDHIETADRETRVFGHRLSDERANKDSRLQLIKSGVARDQCSRLFSCNDAQQFKKVFAQLRWPTSSK